jgi:hypothetical protein
VLMGSVHDARNFVFCGILTDGEDQIVADRVEIVGET